MQPALIFLEAPAKDYLTLAELVTWLGVKDARTARRHMRLGHIPAGKPRAGGKRILWGRVEAAIAKWNLDNLDRYEAKNETQEVAK